MEFINSGPISLSIMVVLSENYLQNLEKNAVELALTFDIAPKTFCQYVDDSHARFGSRNNANEFLNVLNSFTLVKLKRKSSLEP